MWFDIIKQLLISSVIIFTIHYIFNFFKNNLTIPKTKDLIERPKHQYNKIFSIVNSNIDQDLTNDKHKITTNENKSNNMKNDLKNYLKGLMN